jgi:hypothetical protein
MAFWTPKMGDNAPQNPVVPAAYPRTSLTLDGRKIGIRGAKGELAHRPYLWIPANKAILGNVAVCRCVWQCSPLDGRRTI